MTYPRQEMESRAENELLNILRMFVYRDSRTDEWIGGRSLSRALLELMISERDRARELACGAVCEWCREGKPFVELDPIMAQGKKWHKPFPEYPDDPQRVMCHASAIRQAFEEER